MSGVAIERVREFLVTAKPLATEYNRLTGKPLGVNGAIAEYVAAETLPVLADARNPGYGDTRQTPDGPQRIQIKSRTYGDDAKPGGSRAPCSDHFTGSRRVSCADRRCLTGLSRQPTGAASCLITQSLTERATSLRYGRLAPTAPNNYPALSAHNKVPTQL